MAVSSLPRGGPTCRRPRGRSACAPLTIAPGWGNNRNITINNDELNNSNTTMCNTISWPMRLEPPTPTIAPDNQFRKLQD